MFTWFQKDAGPEWRQTLTESRSYTCLRCSWVKNSTSPPSWPNWNNVLKFAIIYTFFFSALYTEYLTSAGKNITLLQYYEDYHEK